MHEIKAFFLEKERKHIKKATINSNSLSYIYMFGHSPKLIDTKEDTAPVDTDRTRQRGRRAS
jgi:hypothetical protein